MLRAPYSDQAPDASSRNRVALTARIYPPKGDPRGRFAVAPASSASRPRDPARELSSHAVSDRGTLAPLSDHSYRGSPIPMADPNDASPDSRSHAEPDSSSAGRKDCSPFRTDSHCSKSRYHFHAAHRNWERVSNPRCRHHVPAARLDWKPQIQYLACRTAASAHPSAANSGSSAGPNLDSLPGSSPC